MSSVADAIAAHGPLAARVSAGSPAESGLRAAEHHHPSRPRFRYWALNASHTVIDVFPIYFTSLLLVLKNNLGLSAAQVSIVVAITPVFSGLCQPVFAWLTDRFNTRVCGPFGLAIGAVCISSIGFAQNFWQLIALQIVGVVGTGMYHPVGAALAGQLGGRVFRRGRGMAISVFIAAGMLGQAAGPLIASRMNEAFGLKSLAWLMIPGLLTAVALHRVIARTPHRHHNHHELHTFDPADLRHRWNTVLVMSVQNSLRFVANIGMFYMFNVWAAAKIPGDAARAAVLNSNLASAMTVGMGISAVVAGMKIRPGGEKAPFVWISFTAAVFIAMFPLVADWGWNAAGGERGGWWAMLPAYVVAACTAMGVFATVPSSLALGQRLLPGRTGMVSSLLMGVGWGVSALAPWIGSWVLGTGDPRQASLLPPGRISMAFFGFAVILSGAGVLAMLMPGRLLRETASHH
ncbi:MAG: MFS transporter [Phycisphaerales bacterium]|nr:MFS transporter [Phycisphaerales bacterium]